MELEIDVEKLIKLVSTRPVVWDPEEYKCRSTTANAWRQICSELFPGFQDKSEKDKRAFCKLIIKKWKNIKDQWRKSMNKCKELEKNGSVTKSAKRYVYYEQLSFLQKTINMKDNESGADEIETPNEVLVDKVDTKTSEDAIARGPTNRKRKIDIVNNILEALSSDENRHLSFFRGILPSLQGLSEDETLHFQAGAINLIQNIKKARITQPPNSTLIPIEAHYRSYRRKLAPNKEYQIVSSPNFSSSSVRGPSPEGPSDASEASSFVDSDLDTQMPN